MAFVDIVYAYPAVPFVILCRGSHSFYAYYILFVALFGQNGGDGWEFGRWTYGQEVTGQPAAALGWGPADNCFGSPNIFIDIQT